MPDLTFPARTVRAALLAALLTTTGARAVTLGLQSGPPPGTATLTVTRSVTAATPGTLAALLEPDARAFLDTLLPARVIAWNVTYSDWQAENGCAARRLQYTTRHGQHDVTHVTCPD